MKITLTGPNDYARLARLKNLKNEFVKSHDEFSLETIDAEEVSLGSLLDSVASVPFLSERRMIILINLPNNKSILENIDKLLDAVADSTDLIIEQAKFDKRSSLYKTLKKNVNVEEFKDVQPAELVSWAKRYIDEQGASISVADIRYLIDRVGPNQMMLYHELDKLISFSPKITRASIDDLVYPTPSSTVFELIETAFNGNPSRAIELYHDQRLQQVEPQAIMGMIGWQLHVIAVVKLNEQKGADYIEKESKLNPYVISKTMRITNKMSVSRVQELIKNALDLDKRLKTETIDADEALQNFILAI